MFLLSGLHREIGVYKSVDIPVHNGVDVSVFKARSRVLRESVGHKYVASYSGAEVDLHLNALDIADLIKVLALLYLGELRSQHRHTGVAVLILAALHLAGDDYARRLMDETDGGGGLVDLLTACSGGAEDLHLDIVLADLYLVIVGYLGHYLDGGEGGLTPAGGVEGGNPDEAVNSALALEISVGVLALDLYRGGLDAGLVSVLPVEQGVLIAVALRPAGIEPV